MKERTTTIIMSVVAALIVSVAVVGMSNMAQDTDVRLWMSQGITTSDMTTTDDLVVGDDAAISGLATVGETLGVTGATTLSSTLAVSNDATVAANYTLTLIESSGTPTGLVDGAMFYNATGLMLYHNGAWVSVNTT